MSDLPVGLTTGSRAVVRTRIDPPPTHGPHLTDTVGEVIALDEHRIRVRTRTGEVTLRRDLVVVARVIPPRPTRRGAPHRAVGIEALHRIMTTGQPGLEESWLGAAGEGWLLRAGRGWTGRSNSALPLGDPGLPLTAAVDAVDTWYRERDLTPFVMLPRPVGAATADDPLGELLLDRGWAETHPADVLTGRTDTLLTDPVVTPAGLTIRRSDHVDEAWLTGGSPRLREHRGTAREILQRPRHQVFLTAQEGEGGPVGVARVAFADGWAGIFGLHVHPTWRGRGVGRWLTQECARAALAARASLTYLQVEPTNEPAQRLHTDLGLRRHHTYVYLALRPTTAPA